MDYQPRHAAPTRTNEPPAVGWSEAPCSARHDDLCCTLPVGHAWPEHIAHNLRDEPVGKWPVAVPASVSIFDAPDAATTHAKQTAQALIHEYQTFASQPGHWTADQSAAWIGQACAVLTELAK
jgi:hypothetical protein